MSLQQHQGAASAAPTFPSAFSPTDWLDTFAALGGTYALMSDRRLALIVGRAMLDDLSAHMQQVASWPERQDALRDAIERRQAGDVGQ